MISAKEAKVLSENNFKVMERIREEELLKLIDKEINNSISNGENFLNVFNKDKLTKNAIGYTICVVFPKDMEHIINELKELGYTVYASTTDGYLAISW